MCSNPLIIFNLASAVIPTMSPVHQWSCSASYGWAPELTPLQVQSFAPLLLQLHEVSVGLIPKFSSLSGLKFCYLVCHALPQFSRLLVAFITFSIYIVCSMVYTYSICIFFYIWHYTSWKGYWNFSQNVFEWECQITTNNMNSKYPFWKNMMSF